MQTARLAYDASSVKRAAELLAAGRLVAFPTETVYGLGARADDAAAVRSIFAAKGRPSENPLIVHVAGVEPARRLVETWTDGAERLAAAFWPGPLTLVLRRREGGRDAIAPEVAAFGPTVALRVPAHPIALDLLATVALPIAAPSANRSTAISPTTADHVLKSLGGRIDLVLDGGATTRGIESTIVDVTQVPAVVLRLGAISLSSIAELVPIVDRAAAIVKPGDRAPAPGGHARHYAPHARVLLVPAASVPDEVAARRARGERVGALERQPGQVTDGIRETLQDDPDAFAAELYAALHRLDDAGCDAIVIADVPSSPAWAAVRDRLRRASAPSNEG